MPINPKKLKKQKELLEKLGLKPQDLEEKFTHASGPGGQHVNKTSSAVHLKHRPTGIEVKASEDRSREINRYLARDKLIEAYQKSLGIQTTKEKQLLKQKKQKQRRQRKSAKKYQSPQPQTDFS